MAAFIDRQVSIGSDDCLRRLTPLYWLLAHTYNLAGAFNTTYYQYGSGMRFTNITIPKGAVINEAHLTLRCLSASSGIIVKARISAEDVDDAPTFADDADAFDTRWAARTTAKVDWDNIPAWTLNSDYDSPDIKTVIQEIVNRDSWASGNDIVIFWEDFEDRSTHEAGCRRDAFAYESSPTYAPLLHIDYTIAVTQELAGVISGVASVSGAALITRGLAGLASGVCAVSGLVGIIRELAGISQGVASVTGALLHVRRAVRNILAIRNLPAVRNLPPER